jgi:antitoxin component HigA of HigAB toxin-antitoxin module
VVEQVPIIAAPEPAEKLQTFTDQWGQTRLMLNLAGDKVNLSQI